ncbi:MAG: efflux RND transporter permease subunit [Gemmatimonadetes bacterium]|jgi:multidrug efflux pump|nr:efflux RND transporter permease subunit [Gemmatimonadota bacterium]
MNLTRTAIINNRVTLVALLVVAFSGYTAYQGMSRAEDPGFKIRTATVITYFPGASPERVEQLVTDKLEKAIQEIPELDFLNSTSRSGVSLVYVNIRESEMDMRPIWDDMRRKVERARYELPDEVIGPIVNDEFGDVFGTIILLTGEGFSYAELKDVADQVRNELLLIPETAKVEIQGAQEERVFIEYSNTRLAEAGLSVYQLMQILQSRNIVLPGGVIDTGDERIALEPSGNFASVDELRRTVIDVPGRSELIYLEDVVSVERGYVDPAEILVRGNGQRGLSLAISLREGGNLIDLGDQVKQRVAQLEARYPIGIEFDFVSFQPDIVQKKVDDFVSNLLQAMAIVMLVMLLTLGLRTGIIVSSLIPMTMISALWMMSLFGIGLDQMSLSALIISLGLLVDNAIVMSESILVGMQRGDSALDAAVDSASELKIPLLTASLTTIAAFLPIYLAESTTGEYVAPLFYVVTISLLCSWVLSLTMTPLMCVQFMRVKPRGAANEEEYGGQIYRFYRSSLGSATRHPWRSLGIVVLAFVGGMQLFGLVPGVFFPPKDQATFTAEFELPIGTPIERTAAMVESVEDFIARELTAGEDRAEGILNWGSFLGQGAPRFALSFAPKMASPEYAMMLINTTSYSVVGDLTQRIERFAQENFPDVNPTVRGMLNGPPISDPIEIRVSGADADQVFALSDEVKAFLASQPGVKNISDNWGARTKKIAVRVDQPRARRAGVTSQDVALSLQASLSGLTTTEYREADELIPVVLRSVAADRDDVGKLESIEIFSQVTGSSVPLKQVADVEVEWQPSKILRRDRLKTVTISAALEPGLTPLAVFDDIRGWIEPASQNWPVGYRWEFGGEYEASVEANASIGVKLPIALLIIVLLLVSQFNSIRRPLIILMTIPLGMVGVGVGLVVADSIMGFMTFLGIISLSGIVINNAIVLLDRIKIEIDENGLSPYAAVIEAGQRRLRPILLTTATTIGGMLPLWYGGGPMFQPMAVAIIFGLLFATLLTLVVVPVLYVLMFRVRPGT